MPTFDSTDLDNAASESGVAHENTANTDHNNASRLKQGYATVNALFNPEALFPMNEDSGSTMYDFSGNGNDGTYDSPTYGYDALLDTTSPDFDGTDDYARHPYDASPSFTAMVWIRSDQSEWSSAGCGWSSRYANGFILHPDGGDFTDQMEYFVVDSTNDYHKLGNGYAPDDITQWHLYSISYNNSTGQAYGYIDDTEVVSTSLGINRGNNSGINATLAHDSLQNYNPGDRPLDGQVQWACYVPSHLTQSEIAQYYNVIATSGTLTTQFKSV